MSKFITCMGECLIDFLPAQSSEGEASVDFRMCAGGSIFNIAVGLTRMGQKTAFACRIADDYFGRYLHKYIQTEAIDTRFLITQKGGKSTLAFVAVEDGSPVFTFYGEGAADTLLTLEDVPEALFTETQVLHFGSNSLSQGTTPATVLKTVERLQGKALLSFDPNIRPDLIRDEAAYRVLLQQLIPMSDVMKLSDADLAWLNPGQSSEQALQELLVQGPKLVVITQGAHGVIAARAGGEMVRIPTFPVEVVDTVGAGDAFCSGLLTQLVERGYLTRDALVHMNEEELDAMLRFAAAAAALNCRRPGANPPVRAEVEQFLQVQTV